jgi:hypothetical protein
MLDGADVRCWPTPTPTLRTEHRVLSYPAGRNVDQATGFGAVSKVSNGSETYRDTVLLTAPLPNHGYCNNLSVTGLPCDMANLARDKDSSFAVNHKRNEIKGRSSLSHCHPHSDTYHHQSTKSAIQSHTRGL